MLVVFGIHAQMLGLCTLTGGNSAWQYEFKVAFPAGGRC